MEDSGRNKEIFSRQREKSKENVRKCERKKSHSEKKFEENEKKQQKKVPCSRPSKLV